MLSPTLLRWPTARKIWPEKRTFVIPVSGGEVNHWRAAAPEGTTSDPLAGTALRAMIPRAQSPLDGQAENAGILAWLLSAVHAFCAPPA